MMKLITRVLGGETAEAAEICDGTLEHRCHNGYYQERRVQYYGYHCQYIKPLSAWRTIAKGC